MTTQLIPVFTGQINHQSVQLVDARLLHEFLEVGKRFASWITERIDEYGFIENQDFICISQKRETQRKNGQRGITKTKEYHLTLDMGKELAMVERNEKGRQARRYFIECEKKLNQSQYGLKDQPKLTTATKEQREPLVKAVRRLVKVAQSKGRSLEYDDAHSIINLKLGVASIEALTPEQIPQAMTLVGEIMEKVVLDGEYIAKGEPEPHTTPEVQTITPKQKQQISEKLYKAFSGWCFTDGCRHHGYNALRVLFSLQNVEDLPADDFQKALDAIDVMKNNNDRFLSAIVDIRDDYMKNYLFSDVPWTPDLKRKWKKLMDSKLPERPDWMRIAAELGAPKQPVI